jgi:1-acyl-sn-glycerol-3-phosphate acyltransferase
MENWHSNFWYDACWYGSALGMTLAFGLRTEGFKHVPASGPALLVSNHQSYLDSVAIGLAARRRLCYLARHGLFDHAFFRLLIRSLKAVPINQEGFAREGLKTILEQLQENRAVLIFPEGERTHDGAVQPLRPGIHLLIKRVAMPVVPLAIAGAYEAWPRWRMLPTPAPIVLPRGRGSLAVSIGSALDSCQLAKLPREQMLVRLCSEINQCRERAEKLRSAH